MAVLTNLNSANKQFYTFVESNYTEEVLRQVYPLAFRKDVQELVWCDYCDSDNDDVHAELSAPDDDQVSEDDEIELACDGLKWIKRHLNGQKVLIDKIDQVKNIVLSDNFKADPLKYCLENRQSPKFANVILQSVAARSSIYKAYYAERYIQVLNDHSEEIFESVFRHERIKDIEKVSRKLKEIINSDMFKRNLMDHVNPFDQTCGCEKLVHAQCRKLDQKRVAYFELIKYLQEQNFDTVKLVQSLPYYTVHRLKQDNYNKPSPTPADSDQES